MLDKVLFLLALAGTAVVFADVLVRPGMLLEPVQRRARELYRDITGRELDEQWWAKPLWLCYKCVAGQWGWWGYVIHYWGRASLLEIFPFTAFTIIAAIILHKWTTEN